MEIYSCFQALDPQTFVTVIVSSRRVRGPCYGLHHIVWQSLAGATDSPSSWRRSHEGLRAQSLQNTVNLYLYRHIICKLFYNICRFIFTYVDMHMSVCMQISMIHICVCIRICINSLHIYGDLQLFPGSGPSDLRDSNSQLEAGPRALLWIAPYCVAIASRGHGLAIELTTISRRSEGPEPAEHRKSLSVSYTHNI